ncbi:MAG: hypothetical protein ACJAUG_002301 [Halioglobus sp.]
MVAGADQINVQTEALVRLFLRIVTSKKKPIPDIKVSLPFIPAIGSISESLLRELSRKT